MSVFFKYTWQSLRKNRSRTMVTIVGIVLSVALVVAIIEGGFSALSYFRNVEIERSGSFHGFFNDMEAEQLDQAKQLGEIDEVVTWRQVGVAEIGSENKYKPYVAVQSVDDNFTNLVGVKIISGRMPANDREILLPVHLENNGGVLFGIGDELTLDLGERYIDGMRVNWSYPMEYLEDSMSGEELRVEETRTYTVVGTYERLSTAIENYRNPCYTAITKGSAKGNYGMFFTVKHPGNFYDFAMKQDISYDCSGHQALLIFYFSAKNTGTVSMLLSFEAVLILIVAVGAISLIYNSFAISISERTKQFGILKSVGATRRQVRHCVFLEALLLSAIGIPIGIIVGLIGIGTTLFLLRDAFITIFSHEAVLASTVEMKLVVDPLSLFVAAGICLMIVLISSYIPARRAMKISPMESIRQSRDVKIKSKTIRTGRLVRFFFGIAGELGAKNFCRSKKSYRVTILSLVLSVFLFIVSTSFINAFKADVRFIFDKNSKEDISYYWGRLAENSNYRELTEKENGLAITMNQVFPSYDEVSGIIDRTEGVSRSVFSGDHCADILVDAANINKHALPYLYVVEDENTAELHSWVHYVEDEVFDTLCEQNGYEPSAFYNKELPAALCYNNYSILSWRDGRTHCDYQGEILTGEGFEASAYKYYWPEGYVSIKWDVEGEYAYYPEAEYTALGEQYTYDEVGQYLEKEKILVISEQEMLQKFTIGGLIEERPFFIMDEMAILLPLSMMEHANLMSRGEVSFTTYIEAKDHKLVYEKIKQEMLAKSLPFNHLADKSADQEIINLVLMILDVFLYGFLVLISLIAITNVFSTISTNVYLRRREYAMLRSIGMTKRELRRMANYECMVYGVKALLLGLPLSLLASYGISSIRVVESQGVFQIPWVSVAIASASVFLTVFFSMIYARKKIHVGIVDELKSELL